LGLLLVVALRPGLNRWLRFTAAIYLLPAVCTSTQILARFPDYTRVWIDVASLALLGCVGMRRHDLASRFVGFSTGVSLVYLVSYFLVAK
jgi:hypothetical protein